MTIILEDKVADRFKNRFQFLVTISLFFPVLFEALIKEANDTTDINKITLHWGTLIAFLITDYILLECVKKWSHKLFYELVTSSFFVNFGAYVVILLMLGQLAGSGHLPGFLYPIFSIAMHALVLIPVIILGLLILNIGLGKSGLGK